MGEDTRTLEQVLDGLCESGEGDTLSVGEVVDHFQQRSLGVLIALVGLIAVIPLVGDIPTVPSIAATVALAAIVQSVRGKSGLWLPGFLRRRSVRRDRVERAVGKARPWVRRVDRLLRPRLTALSGSRVARRIAIGVAALVAATLYPMEFVPFGANASGAALLALGLGLMACDGLLVLIGYALSGVTIYVLWTGFSAAPL